MRHLVRTKGRRPAGRALAVLAAVVLLAVPAASLGAGEAWAQGKAAAPAEAPQPKQTALSQKIIDNLIAAQKQIRDFESKLPKNQLDPDPKTEAKIESIVKANGFASMGNFADVNYSVGVVLSGMDETGTYIGADAVLKKQKADVQADKKMPPKEKKEALDEINAAMGQSGSDKPLPGNVDVVKANAAKLSEDQGD